MQDDDLDKGIQNIKEILLRLENRNFDAELLKDFPRLARAEKPETVPQEPTPPEPVEPQAEAPAPELPAVSQTPELAPVDEPRNTTEPLPGAKALPPPEEAGPLIPGVPESAEAAPVIELEPAATVLPEIAAGAPAPGPAALPEIPAGPPAQALPPVLPEVPRPAEQAPASAPAAPAVKKNAGSRMSTAAFFFLGLAAAAGVYQFGLDSSWYRYRQASKLERVGDKTNALAAYERLVLKYPGTSEAASSQFAIANILGERGEPGAVDSFEKFLRASAAGDGRIPDAKFKLAELRFGGGDFYVAANLYSAPDVRASLYSQKAQDRLDQIRSAQAQAAEAKKLIAREPEKAAAAYAALLAAYPAYAEAGAGLEEARKRQLEVKAAPGVPDKAAAARAKLARSILMANRRHLGAPVPAKGKPLKTFSLNERYAACAPVWPAETARAKLDAGLAAAKKRYDCDALKANLAACEGSREKTRAIENQPAEERAAKVRSVVKDWTVQKQQSLDKKMLDLFKENRCSELAELSAANGEEEAPEGF